MNDTGQGDQGYVDSRSSTGTVGRAFPSLSSGTDAGNVGKGSEGQGSWKEVAPQEKNRLVAAARLALLELESMTSDRAKSRQYFAQPGEAEWGC